MRSKSGRDVWIKKVVSILCVIAMFVTQIPIAFAMTDQATGLEISKTVINLNNSWTFTKEGQSSTVNIPHTWNAEDTIDGINNNYYKGTCTYVKNISIPAQYRDKNLVLRFKAVNKIATVYVNGIQVGQHAGGYTAFTVNITNAVKYGQTNEIKVEVNNSDLAAAPISGDFNFYGGIYRDVDLIATGDTYIYVEDNGSDGVEITSKGSDIKGISADGSKADSAKITVAATVYSSDPNFTATATIAGSSYTMDKRELDTVTSSVYYSVTKDITLSNVTLWNGTKNPYLYTVDITVASSTEMDTVSKKIGIRRFEVDSQRGTFLNGVYYPLRGVAMHQEEKGYGNAVPWSEKQKDFELIKELGANFIRFAHYPHMDEEYSKADELGIMAWCEIPFVGAPGAGAADTDEFKNSVQQQTVEMIRQYQNHPSIVVWGIQNEVQGGKKADGQTAMTLDDLAVIVKAAADKAKAEDPTRLTTQALMHLGSYSAPTVEKSIADFGTDLSSVNVYYGWYVGGAPEFGTEMDRLHTKFPTKSIGVSEYGAGSNTSQHQIIDDTFKWYGTDRTKPASAFGSWHPEEYENDFHEKNWVQIQARPWIWQTSIWNMFDFAVDSRNEGSQPELNDKGLVTADRQIKKDVFYFYKAQWNKTDKFVYIASRRYTNRTENVTPVKVYSNCDSVTLTVNGKDYGVGIKQQDGVFVWNDVVLADSNNNVVATGTYDGNKTTTDTVAAWTVNQAANSETVVSLNQGWTFTKEGQSSTVNIPHTWNAEDTIDGINNNYYKGTCTYVKNIDIPANYSGKNLVLRFKAANRTATVYVNGVQVGQHEGGYTAFTVNITNAVNYGQTNEIKVVVDNKDITTIPLSGDFNNFGGIYRDVDLLVQSDMYIYAEDNGSSGVKITSNGANISGISSDGSKADSAKITVSATVYSKSSSFTATADIGGSTYLMDKQSLGNNLYTVSKDITLSNVTLWNGTKNPYLYTVDVNVASNMASVNASRKIGIRKFEVDSQKGTFLNGVSYPLRGVNIHQDKKGFGYAMTWEERKKDLDLIKEVGANTIRAAHYPHMDEVYSMADELGLVVWAEIPFVDKILETDTFKDNAEQQLVEMIRQYYNHPSIVVWGLENEINFSRDSGEVEAAAMTKKGEVLKRLLSKAKAEDPTRLTTQAISDLGKNFIGKDHTIAVDTSIEWGVDISSVNVYFGWYVGSPSELGPELDRLHQKYPTQVLGVSEYGAGSNPLNHTNLPQNPTLRDGSAHTEEYQSYFHEESYKTIQERPWLWATHIWNMFDFAVDSRNEGGQPELNDKGLVTYDRQIKKDVFYFYKAQWNKTDKFVYITSRRYTDRKETMTPVKVYSNCDSVTLTVNGKNLGAGTKQQDGVFVWNNVVLMGSNNVVATGTYDGNKTTADTVTSWITENALTKPFAITAVGSGLVKEGGITATVDVSTIAGIATHEGDEVVLFELMNGTTPVSIVALQKDINSTDKRLSAFFNVDPNSAAYTVKVFILDKFDNTNTSAPTSLAEPITLN